MSNSLPHTSELIEQGIARNLHLGAQLYVSQHGKTIADLAFGESRPSVPMSVETINPWMSSGKPVTAFAIAQLWERGLLDLDDRVARHIPEFGVRGKEPITIRHLLTHTGGFRAVIGLQWDDPWDQAIAKVCNAPLEPRWMIGKTAGYHAASSWYVLGELVRRLDGRRIDQFAREQIFAKLEMTDCWLGIPEAKHKAYGDRIGQMFEMKNGEPRPIDPGSSPSDAAAIRPSSNMRGPIRELARFYEHLLQRSNPGLLSIQTMEAMTARHRAGAMDLTFKHVMDMGLGFIINSTHYGGGIMPYGYGPHASMRAFGHSGQRSSCAFCDPDHSLVVAWVCNGMPEEEPSHRRQHELNAAIYEELGLFVV